MTYGVMFCMERKKELVSLGKKKGEGGEFFLPAKGNCSCAGDGERAFRFGGKKKKGKRGSQLVA